MTRYIETELGTEKLCIHCNEYWPLDDEFWYFKNNTTKKGVVRQAMSVCKCCYIPHYKPHLLLRAKKNNIENNSYAQVMA